MYDILVVGAGPIGSYLASRLAKEGFKTAIFEEDKEVGKVGVSYESYLT